MRSTQAGVVKWKQVKIEQRIHNFINQNNPEQLIEIDALWWYVKTYLPNMNMEIF
jgi:hypothetical protein